MVRFGLLGTGGWALRTQAAALAAHPGVDFAGVWGRNPDNVAELARRFGVRGYPDVDDLLADVEAVAVALPPDIQADLAVRAAGRGCHLLLEKPLALSTAAADRVVTAVDDAGVASVIFFTNRFVGSVRNFLDEARRTGTWTGGRAVMFASIFGPDSPYARSSWRRQWGGLWDVGPHALSLLLPVLGPVDRVSAFRGPYDTTHVLMRHRDGAASTMALSLDVPATMLAAEFVFHGPPGFHEVPQVPVDPADPFQVAIGELLDNVRSGRTRHPCDVRFGREVVGVLQAADKAARQGTVERP